MTDSFLNCQQDLSPEKFLEKKLSFGYFAEKVPWTGMGVSRKFSEKENSF